MAWPAPTSVCSGTHAGAAGADPSAGEEERWRGRTFAPADGDVGESIIRVSSCTWRARRCPDVHHRPATASSPPPTTGGMEDLHVSDLTAEGARRICEIRDGRRFFECLRAIPGPVRASDPRSRAKPCRRRARRAGARCPAPRVAGVPRSQPGSRGCVSRPCDAADRREPAPTIAGARGARTEHVSHGRQGPLPVGILPKTPRRTGGHGFRHGCLLVRARQHRDTPQFPAASPLPPPAAGDSSALATSGVAAATPSAKSSANGRFTNSGAPRM